MSRQATFPYTREDGQLRPKIPVIFYNKDKPEFFERIVCLVDLGADTCVLPIDWKSRLKIKCDNDDDSINCACGQSIPAPQGDILFEIEHESLKGKKFITKCNFVNLEAAAYNSGKKSEEIDIPPLFGRDALKHFEIILPENYKDFTFKLND